MYCRVSHTWDDYDRLQPLVLSTATQCRLATGLGTEATFPIETLATHSCLLLETESDGTKQRRRDVQETLEVNFRKLKN
jgi:hypothetical protein